MKRVCWALSKCREKMHPTECMGRQGPHVTQDGPFTSLSWKIKWKKNKTKQRPTQGWWQLCLPTFEHPLWDMKFHKIDGSFIFPNDCFPPALLSVWLAKLLITVKTSRIKIIKNTFQRLKTLKSGSGKWETYEMHNISSKAKGPRLKISSLDLV